MSRRQGVAVGRGVGVEVEESGGIGVASRRVWELGVAVGEGRGVGMSEDGCQALQLPRRK